MNFERLRVLFLISISVMLLSCQGQDKYIQGYWKFYGIFDTFDEKRPGPKYLNIRKGLITVAVLKNGTLEDTGLVWGEYQRVDAESIRFKHNDGDFGAVLKVTVSSGPIMVWILPNGTWKFERTSPDGN